MKWLYAEIALGHNRGEESGRAELAVNEVKKGDIENVVRKWDAQLSIMGVTGAEAQEIAMAANEQFEEDEANAMFSGGLLETLPKVENEPTYQTGRIISIPQR